MNESVVSRPTRLVARKRFIISNEAGWICAARKRLSLIERDYSMVIGCAVKWEWMQKKSFCGQLYKSISIILERQTAILCIFTK